MIYGAPFYADALLYGDDSAAAIDLAGNAQAQAQAAAQALIGKLMAGSATGISTASGVFAVPATGRSLYYGGDFIAGAQVYGGGGLGVLGSEVPATGEHGPGYLYNDLSLPADAGKEVSGYIEAPPVGLTNFFAWEDSSFEAAGPSGEYGFTYRLFVDGADLGTAVASISIANAADLAGAAQGQASAAGGLSVQPLLHGAAAAAGSASGTLSGGGASAVDLGGSAQGQGSAAASFAGGPAPLAGAATGQGAATAGLSIVPPVFPPLSVSAETTRRSVVYAMSRYAAQPLETIDVDEIDIQPFDFAPGLAAGETLIGAPYVECEVYQGLDVAPAAVLVGAAVWTGGAVLQRIRGRVAGVTYLLRCRITLSSSRELVAAGLLPCVRL